MVALKYKKIKTLKQYNEYCDIHESFLLEDNDELQDEIELLEILFEHYDRTVLAASYRKLDPVELLKSLLANNNLSQAKLAEEIKISKQLLNDILNYRRNISKEMVKKLATHFAMNEKAFSRKYELKKVGQIKPSAAA